MPTCNFCKNEFPKKSSCQYCGQVLFANQCVLFYGSSKKEKADSAFILTNRYLLLRKISKSEAVTDSLGFATGRAVGGLVGGLIGGLISEGISSLKTYSFGFYDLAEIQKVIYPYNAPKLKGKATVKFVNKDGSDFVIYFNDTITVGHLAKKLIAQLQSLGIYVEDGSSIKNDVICARPFVNADTFGRRICPSAASFVHKTDEQFCAVPVSNLSNNYAQQTQAYQQNYAQQTYSQPVQQSQPTQVTNNYDNEPKKMCPNCGAICASNAQFCGQCGNRF